MMKMVSAKVPCSNSKLAKSLSGIKRYIQYTCPRCGDKYKIAINDHAKGIIKCQECGQLMMTTETEEDKKYQDDAE
jgi:DNA-directed RNA polymerase subunit RPC12/RpoP